MASLLKGPNGQWIEAGNAKTFEVTNPSTGAVIASVPDMTAGDVNMAIDAAAKVLHVLIK